MKSKFKCWKTNVYRSCKNCLKVHDNMCDYHRVMDFEPIEKRNRCPICIYKRIYKQDNDKCIECCEHDNNKVTFSLWNTQYDKKHKATN